MDAKEGSLSLDEIHKSIEVTLNNIQQQHKEVCDVM